MRQGQERSLFVGSAGKERTLRRLYVRTSNSSFVEMCLTCASPKLSVLKNIQLVRVAKGLHADELHVLQSRAGRSVNKDQALCHSCATR